MVSCTLNKMHLVPCLCSWLQNINCGRLRGEGNFSGNKDYLKFTWEFSGQANRKKGNKNSLESSRFIEIFSTSCLKKLLSEETGSRTIICCTLWLNIFTGENAEVLLSYNKQKSWDCITCLRGTWALVLLLRCWKSQQGNCEMDLSQILTWQHEPQVAQVVIVDDAVREIPNR